MDSISNNPISPNNEINLETTKAIKNQDIKAKLPAKLGVRQEQIDKPLQLNDHFVDLVKPLNFALNEKEEAAISRVASFIFLGKSGQNLVNAFPELLKRIQ